MTINFSPDQKKNFPPIKKSFPDQKKVPRNKKKFSKNILNHLFISKGVLQAASTLNFGDFEKKIF